MHREIIGQRQLLDCLRDAVRSRRLSHSYIFEGPRGVGKRTLADFFAAAIHCRGKGQIPCGVCDSCIKHAGGNHPDYTVVTLSGDGDTIGVETARRAAEDMYIRPFLAEKKIYVFPEADALTVQAQNALLKVLEEPPQYTIVLLLAENAENLLETVRSRAIRVQVQGNTAHEVYEYILANYPDFADRAQFIARYSGGLIGRAEDIISNPDFMLLRKTVFESVASLTGGMSEALAGAEMFTKLKNEHDEALEIALTWFRDSIVLGMLGYDAPILNEDYRAELLDFTKNTGTKSAMRCAESCVKMGMAMTKGANYGLWLTEFFIKCWEEIHGTHSGGQV